MKRVLSFLSSSRTLAFVLGISSLVVAALVRFFLPELTVSVIALLILSLILIVICLIGAHREIMVFLSGRRGRYGLNTLVAICLFITILVLANYLGIIKHRRFDVTAAGNFTLAPQTINVIKGLREPVEAIGFFPRDPQLEPARERARYLLEEYGYFNRNFHYRFVDPDTTPALARQYRVRYHGTIVFVSGPRQKAVSDPAEQEFTSALLEVSGKGAKKVYFLTGHGERAVNDDGQEGYGEAGRGLIRDLYKVETLNLTLTPEVPEDCAVLIMAGAKKAFPPGEKKAVEAYLKRSGKLLLLTDPDPPAEVEEILAEWGMMVEDGHIIDRGAYAAPDMATPAVFRGNYPPVAITADLETTYFPEAASVNLTDELERVIEGQEKKGEEELVWPRAPVQYKNLVIMPLLVTTELSWLEGELKNAGPGKREKIKGPLALGAMIIASGPVVTGGSSEAGEKEKLTRMVVLGDSDFAANIHIQNGGNGDLFLNAVNWLAEEEHLIYVRPKHLSFRRLLVSKDAERFIRYSSIALLPLLVLILGGIIWWRKR